MKTSSMLSILAVGIVLIVGGYLLLKPHTKEIDGKTVAMSDTSGVKPIVTGKKIPFTDFMKQSGSYKCTVNQNVNNTETKGTVYMDNGMIRGEYNTKVQGMNIDSTLIVRDGFTYTWTSMLPNMGFKSKVVATKGDTSASASGTYSFHAEQIGDYNCEAWTLDSSKFTVPTNITFKETGV